MPNMLILKERLEVMWNEWFKEVNSEGLFKTPKDISFAFHNFKSQSIHMLEELEKELD